MEKIHICLSTDDNYALFALSAILSIIDNKNPEDELVFHILHSSLSAKNCEKLASVGNVVLHKIDNSIFEPYFNNGVCKNVTIPTLYRLMLPSLLPDVQRILYLDCDLVVLKSLSPLYYMELDNDQYAAAVSDLGYNLHMLRMKFEDLEKNFYFNAGVCLMDLEKMRCDNIEEKMFDYLKTNWQNLSYSDQDVMNAVLLGHVKRLDNGFNFITPNFYFNNRRDVTIAHFAGMKPWKVGFYNPYRELFRKYYIKAGGSKKLDKRISKWEQKFFQILLHIKMYPFFFTKKNHRDDFLKIIKGCNY